MEPMDDEQLRALLREWRVENAPARLDERVLPRHTAWWRFLLRGRVRVPVPVAVGCAVALTLMGAALARDHGLLASRAKPAGISLAGFQPVREMHVRIIEGQP